MMISDLRLVVNEKLKYLFSELPLFYVLQKILSGVRILKHIKNSLRAKFKCLKVILSWYVENMLGVLLPFKISRSLIEFKPFKTSCEGIFFSIRIVF